MLKKLVASDKKVYHIDRDKISCIIQSELEDNKTAFIIDGQWVVISIHVDNALNWIHR